jgi:ribosome-associated protein
VDVLEISDQLSIPMSEIDMTAVRSQGAGGQNVNKVSTAIHLRFDIRNSMALPEALRSRLLKMSDSRISADGVLIIKSQQRLAELLQKAMQQPKKRVPTRLSKKAKQKRLDEKSRRSAVKKARRKPGED